MPLSSSVSNETLVWIAVGCGIFGCVASLVALGMFIWVIKKIKSKESSTVKEMKPSSMTRASSLSTMPKKKKHGSVKSRGRQSNTYSHGPAVPDDISMAASTLQQGIQKEGYDPYYDNNWFYNKRLDMEQLKDRNKDEGDGDFGQIYSREFPGAAPGAHPMPPPVSPMTPPAAPPVAPMAPPVAPSVASFAPPVAPSVDSFAPPVAPPVAPSLPRSVTDDAGGVYQVSLGGGSDYGFSYSMS